MNSSIKIILSAITFLIFHTVQAQNVLTPKALIEMNRISAIGITKDMKQVVYRISKVDVATNTRNSEVFIIPIEGGETPNCRRRSED